MSHHTPWKYLPSWQTQTKTKPSGVYNQLAWQVYRAAVTEVDWLSLRRCGGEKPASVAFCLVRPWARGGVSVSLLVPSRAPRTLNHSLVMWLVWRWGVSMERYCSRDTFRGTYICCVLHHKFCHVKTINVAQTATFTSLLLLFPLACTETQLKRQWLPNVGGFKVGSWDPQGSLRAFQGVLGRMRNSLISCSIQKV